MKKRLSITLLVDHPKSWLISYAKTLQEKLRNIGHHVRVVSDLRNMKKGDISFFLGFLKIVPKEYLQLHNYNLVIHESALPKGRGWSPLTWQILEGKKQIPITLFEASEDLDSGSIYLQEMMEFNGYELIEELRAIQGQKTIDLAMGFIKSYPNVSKHSQRGRSSYYKHRTPKDSELNINKTLKTLFNQLRVVDNERYPAFFCYNGHTYVITIKKQNTPKI